MSLMCWLGITGVILVGAVMWLKRYQEYVARRPWSRNVMLILGSGGHTGELLHIMGRLKGRHSGRIYIIGSNDPISYAKAQDFEAAHGISGRSRDGIYEEVLRLRNVGDGLLITLFRLPVVIYQSLNLIIKHQPDAIVCNGPGICVPLCLITFLMRKLKVSRTQILFVESICRVDDLSVTGQMMLFLADDFFVQWEELKEKINREYPHRRNVSYYGRIA